VEFAIGKKKLFTINYKAGTNLLSLNERPVSITVDPQMRLTLRIN